MESICLDLENYTVDEILKLLSLPSEVSEITQSHLKQARKKVLMTHPDKSNLDASIFRFYLEAYTAVDKLVSFVNRSKTSECAYLSKHGQIDREIESGIGNNELIEAGYLTKDGTIGKNWNKFNKKFNEWFDKNSQLLDEEEGYTEFLKSKDDLLPENATKEEATAFIEKRRKHLMSVCKYEEIQYCDSFTSSTSFGSKYGEDLRQAYTHTVVPVDEQDFHNKRKYSSIDELQRARYMDTKDIDYEEGKKIHSEQIKQEDKQDLDRFFNQISLFEKKKQAVKQFQKDLFRIRN